MIFSLTENQAAALIALELGARIRAESMAARLQLIDALERKGLVTRAPPDGAVTLTALGSIAAALCASLALARINGRAHGGSS